MLSDASGLDGDERVCLMETWQQLLPSVCLSALSCSPSPSFLPFPVPAGTSTSSGPLLPAPAPAPAHLHLPKPTPASYNCTWISFLNPASVVIGNLLMEGKWKEHSNAKETRLPSFLGKHRMFARRLRQRPHPQPANHRRDGPSVASSKGTLAAVHIGT